MRSVFVITMWSGGRPAKKWKSLEEPKPVKHGTGVSFVSCDTRLRVVVIGSISVEQFESGKEEIEMVEPRPAPRRRPRGEDVDGEGEGSNIERIY